MPFLLQRAAGEQWLTNRVDGERLRIGRGTNCELRFDDAGVALEHAVIQRQGGGYRLLDRGSITGTYLNGRPVTDAPLARGDVMGIGPYRLRVEAGETPAGAAGDEPLVLEVRVAEGAEGGGVATGAAAAGGARSISAAAAAATSAGAAGTPTGAAGTPAGAAATAAGAAATSPAMPPPSDIDYGKAYRLRRPFFTKGLLGLVLVAAGAAALLRIASTGKLRLFEPGGVHASHANLACADCHAPWQGPAADRCAQCHASRKIIELVHQARQTPPPSCTDCHPEHRGETALDKVADRACVACHGDLRVADGGPLRFARAVHGFAADHPEFAVTLGTGSGMRLPLAVAEARRADPIVLRFDHRLHLRPALRTPAGAPAALRCESCHRPDAGATGMEAGDLALVATGIGGSRSGMARLTYENACATSGCHPLTFDERQPDRVAPHGEPKLVRDFLLGVYSNRAPADLSVRELNRRLIQSPQAPPRLFDFSAAAQRRVIEAERYLFRTACQECHRVEADVKPLPRIIWLPMPASRLPYALFSHVDHRDARCADCHPAAGGSTTAADVLLPGIAVCGRCHAGDGREGSGSRPPASRAGAGPGAQRAASTACVTCHRYHRRLQPPVAAAHSALDPGALGTYAETKVEPR
jgi:hypothetical protein